MSDQDNQLGSRAWGAKSDRQPQIWRQLEYKIWGIITAQITSSMREVSMAPIQRELQPGGLLLAISNQIRVDLNEG